MTFAIATHTLSRLCLHDLVVIRQPGGTSARPVVQVFKRRSSSLRLVLLRRVCLRQREEHPMSAVSNQSRQQDGTGKKYFSERLSRND